jgi:hypothetical protein
VGVVAGSIPAKVSAGLEDAGFRRAGGMAFNANGRLIAGRFRE